MSPMMVSAVHAPVLTTKQLPLWLILSLTKASHLLQAQIEMKIRQVMKTLMSSLSWRSKNDMILLATSITRVDVTFATTATWWAQGELRCHRNVREAYGKIKETERVSHQYSTTVSFLLLNLSNIKPLFAM